MKKRKIKREKNTIMKSKNTINEQPENTFSIEDVKNLIKRDFINVNATAYSSEIAKEIPVFSDVYISLDDLPELKSEYPKTEEGITNFLEDIFYSIYKLAEKEIAEKHNISPDELEYIDIDFDLTETQLYPLLTKSKIIREIPVEYKEEEHRIPIQFERIKEQLNKLSKLLEKYSREPEQLELFPKIRIRKRSKKSEEPITKEKEKKEEKVKQLELPFEEK